MSRAVLEIYNDYNGEYVERLQGVNLEAIDISHSKAHLMVKLSSYRLTEIERLQRFCGFLSDKYPDYSIDIFNKFDISSFSGRFANFIKNVLWRCKKCSFRIF